MFFNNWIKKEFLTREEEMRIIASIFLVVVCFSNASCASVPMSTLSPYYSDEKAIAYAKKMSYFVIAESRRGSVLRVERGMAVILMKKNGRCILATAKHIIQDASFITVMPLDGDSITHKKIKADVIYVDSSEDLAFLSVEMSDKSVDTRMEMDENLLIGKPVFTYRHISDNSYKLARGRIIDVWKLPNNAEVIAVEMSIEKGFSGAGVFDDAGILVGLAIGQARDKRFDVAYLISGPKIWAALFKSKII
ncbi:MAG: serine protease [Candidatus Moraniibacteriota bacterium]